MPSNQEIIAIILSILAFLIAIIGHEIMHGYVAFKYGDNTAKNQNRLNINPIVHIDLVGSIILPAILYFSNAGFLFGWAKPVPVNINTVIQNGGYLGAVYVSLAGIAYNFFLAFLSFVLLYLFYDPSLQFIMFFIAQLLVVNIVLGVFNLYPIPPLDGSNALAYLGLVFHNNFFARIYNVLEPYGIIILLVILITPLSHYLFFPINAILGAIFQ